MKSTRTRPVSILSCISEHYLSFCLADASVKTLYWLSAEGPVSLLSISLPSIFSLGKRLHRDGISALFSFSKVDSRTETKAAGSESSFGDNDDRQRSKSSQDPEIGEDSCDKTLGIGDGGNRTYTVAVAPTEGDERLREPPAIAAILVRNDFSVHTAR